MADEILEVEEGAVEMLGGEAEELDEVPGQPARRAKEKRPTSGRRSAAGSGRKRTPVQRGSGGAAKVQRQPGAEIGRIHRRGLSLAVKFSLCISALIILISLLFGLVVISIFRNKLKADIIRSGYQQVLSLRPFGRRIFENLTDSNIGNGDTERYRASEQGQEDARQLKRIVESDKRIYDIAIMAAKSATKNPNGRVLAVKDAHTFTSPKESMVISMLGEEALDPDFTAWEGSFGKEPVIFFQLPIEGSGEHLIATVKLILSQAQVEAEVRSLLTKIALFGLVFVGAGIALSLFLASAVTSPINVLVRDMDIVARGDLEHETRPQTADEIGLLATAFNRMTHNLKDAQEQEREVERLNSELDLAKEIHAKLLPEKLPHLPGYDIFTGYHCAKEVGGDYYDFIPVDPERLAFVIADVSGKGIPGSMWMANTRTILRMMAPMNLSPADVLSKTNYHVARDIKRGMFVTCLYAILNVRTREMILGSAGHNPMIIWRQKQKKHELVRPPGIALGFDKGPIFNRIIREQKVQLQRGDRVVLYTDGVPEAMSEQREEWGEENLVRFCTQYAHLSSKEFVRLMVTTLEEHKGNAEQHDDITLTTFRIE